MYLSPSYVSNILGGTNESSGGPGGAGGGGAGAGGNSGSNGVAGTANTGGGGGSGNDSPDGANGGSGIVVVEDQVQLLLQVLLAVRSQDQHILVEIR